MFGAHFFSQSYFGQVNAGGGLIDSYPVKDLEKATTASITGVNKTLGLVGKTIVRLISELRTRRIPN